MQSATALFQTIPGATFLVNGAAQAPDTALPTASADMQWLNGWSAPATFEGEFSDTTRARASSAMLGSRPESPPFSFFPSAATCGRGKDNE
jgi:hypothetical protein